MPRVLYVYAIGDFADLTPLEALDAIDGEASFDTAGSEPTRALFSEVDAAAFSQDEIDRRSSDLEWLSGIVMRHEAVVAALARSAAIVPLRAFTLFSTREALEEYLSENGSTLQKNVDRLRGREEWTIKIEFEADRWSEALVGRVDSLRRLCEEIRGASEGKAFLLRKKLEEATRKAARQAEESLISEIEAALKRALPDTPTIVETRQQKGGSFPQINVLVAAAETDSLRHATEEEQRRHEGDGVRLTLTGPWPPYSFASGE
jgi:hypothetical protein